MQLCWGEGEHKGGGGWADGRTSPWASQSVSQCFFPSSSLPLSLLASALSFSFLDMGTEFNVCEAQSPSSRIYSGLDPSLHLAPIEWDHADNCKKCSGGGHSVRCLKDNLQLFPAGLLGSLCCSLTHSPNTMVILQTIFSSSPLNFMLKMTDCIINQAQ